MTAVLPATTACGTSSPGGAAPPAAVLRLPWRLVRRSTLLLWLAVATYMATEVAVFRTAYPDEASRQRLRELATSSAVRMMQGDPSSVRSAGGFAAWDGGWMLMLIVGTWALLTTTRLTRGEEDSGRAELVLSRPVTAARALGGVLGVASLAAAGVAASIAAPFLLLGEPVAGTVLWGLGVGAFAAVTAALGALLAQVLEPRRRVVSVGLALVAAEYLLRVVANSADERSWVLSTTPFGWVDRLGAFGDRSWGWLAVPVLAAAALSTAALLLARHRDSGGALVRASARHRSELRMLGGPAAFGWRLAAGTLLAWALTLGVTMVVFGLLTGTMVDFVTKDETYRKLLESMGMDMSVPVLGYLSYIALFLALPLAAFTGWRLGSIRQEEAEGRLDNLLTRGVVRWRWIALMTGQALAAGVLLLLVSGAGLWLGTWLSDSPVSLRQLAEPLVGTLPVVVLFTGLAVLVLAGAPRLTVAVPVTLAVLSYLLDTFGSAFRWPHAMVLVSPFHHLARLPAQPMTGLAITVMLLLGVAAATAGVVIFSRRDLRGA